MNAPQLILPPGFDRRGPPGLHLPGLSVKGEYRYIKLNAKREVVFETDWQKNLVLNSGLDRIGAGLGCAPYCRIGTGNTAPANTDTQLVAQSAATSNIIGSSQVNAGASNYETQATLTYEFALGAVVGNMAEIGVGWASTGATLFSRALIVDGGGSPTTITVLVSEILQVVYRFTVFPNLADSSGAVTIGSANTYLSRTANAGSVLSVRPDGALLGGSIIANAYNNVIGATTGVPTGTSTALTSGAYAAYTNGNYYRDYSLSAALAVGNLSGGIKSILVSIWGSFGAIYNTQIQFGTAIAKDSTKVLSLTLRQAWSRHP